MSGESSKKPAPKHRYRFNNIKPLTFKARKRKNARSEDAGDEILEDRKDEGLEDANNEHTSQNKATEYGNIAVKNSVAAAGNTVTVAENTATDSTNKAQMKHQNVDSGLGKNLENVHDACGSPSTKRIRTEPPEMSNKYKESNAGMNNKYKETNTGMNNKYKESNAGMNNKYKENNAGMTNNPNEPTIIQREHSATNIMNNNHNETNTGENHDCSETNTGNNNDYSETNTGNNNDSIIAYGISNHRKNTAPASTPLTSMRKVSIESSAATASSPLKIVSAKSILDNDLVNFESIGKSSPSKSIRSTDMSRSQQRRVLLKKGSWEKEKLNNSADTSSLIFGLNSSLHIDGPNLEAEAHVYRRHAADESTAELLNDPPKLSPEKQKESHVEQKESHENNKPVSNEHLISQIKELYGSDAFETSKNGDTNDTKSTILRDGGLSAADESDGSVDSDSSDDAYLFEMLQRKEEGNRNVIREDGVSRNVVVVKEEVDKKDVIKKEVNKTDVADKTEVNGKAAVKEEANKNVIREEEVNKKEALLANWAVSAEDLSVLAYPELQCKRAHSFLRLLILDSQWSETGEFILRCSDINARIYSLFLHAPWNQDISDDGFPYKLREIIHVVSFREDDSALINETDIYLKSDSEILLVVAADTMLSGTTLSDGLTCQRQTVIKRRYALPSEPSIHLIRGTVIHELFQNLLQLLTQHHDDYAACSEILGSDSLDHMLSELLEKYKDEIVVSTDMPLDEFRSSLEKDFFPNIKSFMAEYILDKPGGKYAKIDVQGNAALPFKINRIHNIEETIDSPLLGLKGIIDATIVTNFGFIPMEIKTGKVTSMKHQVQTVIYALLLWEKYSISVRKFLMVYLGGYGTYTLNNVVFSDFKQMLHFRNRMIHFFKDEMKDHGGTLPDLLKGSSATCERECGAQETCTVLNHLSRMNDKDLVSADRDCEVLGSDIDSNIDSEVLDSDLDANVLLSRDFVDLVIGHVSRKEKDFFERYYKMLQLEDEANAFDIKSYFLNRSEDTENCVGMMKLVETKAVKNSKGIDERFELTFAFDPYVKTELNGVSVYDNCILSDEMGHYRLDFVTVLEVDYLKGVLKTAGTKNVMNSVQKRYKDSVLFRVDHVQFDMPNKIAKFNLVSLLSKRNVMLKNLIIHPENNMSTERIECFKSFNVDMINWQSLNPDQREAIKKCLSADRYSLIRGMPGTGKTQVITELLRCLIMNGKKVLITSFTHSAVDNIILKLVGNGCLNDSFRIVRLGNKTNINKKVHQFAITENIEDHSQLQRKYREANLVATTCLSANNFMVNEILKQDSGLEVPEYSKFDYCILDEATQVNLPITLGPLACSRKFILVGDDNQLSPLVKSKEAIEMGLKESLFSKLGRIDPSNITNLTVQYRMNEDIMKLSNFLVYNDLLKCGDSNRHQYLPEIRNLSASFARDSLEYKLLDNKQSVLFIDYKNKLSSETDYTEALVKDSLVNVAECQIVSKILDLFKNSYGEDNQEFNFIDDVGILSIYRAQLNLLFATLAPGEQAKPSQKRQHLEILTADQFQGRDKKCIIISFVRSNARNEVGASTEDGILNDLERINVSITRSKCKLIMIGNSETLGRYSVIKKLFDGVLFKEPQKYVHTL